MNVPQGFEIMSTPQWNAVATRPRHEKVVAEQLSSASIEVFLPMVSTPSRWKDRNVLIDRPIFPGYVFTRIESHERKTIYTSPGVVRILSFNGKAAVIDDSEIEAVRICLSRGINPAPHPFPAVGETVRVKSGALQGLQGIVIRLKKECRIVVSIGLIHRSISAEIDVDLLESADASPASGCDHDWPRPAGEPSLRAPAHLLGRNAQCLAGT